MLIGLIADTHGYLDPRVPPALKGVDLILHAGDIGAEGVLAALEHIAPVTAVAGNNDAKLAQFGLPLRVDVELDGVKLHLVHRLIDAAPGPGTRIVVYGHSHKALVAKRGGLSRRQKHTMRPIIRSATKKSPAYRPPGARHSPIASIRVVRRSEARPGRLRSRRRQLEGPASHHPRQMQPELRRSV